MKIATTVTAAALMSFGIVDTALAAYEFNPESTKFTSSGTTSATKNGITLKCDAVIAGKVNAYGVGSVTGGSFSGQVGCSSVSLSGLPWKALALSKTGARIYNVTFTSPIGNCGPSNLNTILKSGVVSFSNQKLAGGCTVSGKLATKPTLLIVNDGP